MTTKQNVYGEGNYEASRQYNEATKKFVESGRVEEAAREAAPKSPEDAADMKHAEEAALLRAKEKSPPVKDPQRPDPAIEEPERDPRQPDNIDARKRRADNGPDSP